MKRILYPLIGIFSSAVLMCSCLGDGDGGSGGTTDPITTGVILHNSAVSQSLTALDPFNIAFRLNALLVAGNGDVNNAPTEVKDELFGRSTEIKCTYEHGEYKYQIRFYGMAGTKDLVRAGKVEIVSIALYLTDPQATWKVSIPKEEAYALQLKYTGNNSSVTQVDISAAFYLIQNVGENTWKADMMSFNSAPKNTSQQFQADWTASYTIKQESGDQSLKGISSSNYAVDIDVQGATSMFLRNKIIVKTTTPLQFSATCPAMNTIVGNGTMEVAFSENPESKSVSQWLGDDSDCKTKVRITYDGESEEFYQNTNNNSTNPTLHNIDQNNTYF